MIITSNNASEIHMYDPELINEPIEQMMDPTYWNSRYAIVGSAKGRGTTWFIQQNKEITMALRHYYRGGLFGRLVRESYLYLGWHRTRCIKELKLLDHLYKQGINVPRPIAARAVRCGFYYKADILTQKIEGAQDLISLLKNQRLSPEMWQKIGYHIALLHKQHVNHTDLNAHNILIDKQDSIWFIDFDQCKLQSFNYWRIFNLRRLKRSFLKEKKNNGIRFAEHNWLDLMQGYYDNINHNSSS